MAGYSDDLDELLDSKFQNIILSSLSLFLKSLSNFGIVSGALDDFQNLNLTSSAQRSVSLFLFLCIPCVKLLIFGSESFFVFRLLMEIVMGRSRNKGWVLCQLGFKDWGWVCRI